MKRPVNIFLSYAVQDEHFARSLTKHLAMPLREGLINVLNFGGILPGVSLAKQSEKFIDSADIIIFLISADFWASDSANVALERALRRHEASEAVIIPVLVRPTVLSGPITELRSLPRNYRPLTSWPDLDSAYHEIAQELVEATQFISARVGSDVSVKQPPQSSRIPVDENFAPTASSLRAVLERVLRLDSDFNAFVLDFFPRTYKRMFTGMDRTAKFNVFLEAEDHVQILASLRRAYPERLAQSLHLLKFREDGRLPDLTRQFFTAAGRKISQDDARRLQAPELVWLAEGVPPDPGEVRDMADRLGKSQLGFFVHWGALPSETVVALDQQRVEGHSIVPISGNIMTAALADGNARAILSELEETYRGTDNLFDTFNALVDERFLFGRQHLLSQVGGALARGEHVLISGLRKAGKTSFLNILRQHLSRHPVCMVDLQRYDRRGEQWPPKLYAELVAAFDQWGHAEFRDWPEQPSRPMNGSELETALLQRRRWQIQRGRDDRMIVVLDEIERILPAPGQAAEAHRYLQAAGALRVLGQRSGDRFLSLIGADLRPDVNRLNLIGDSGTNPLFSLFHEIDLPLLAEEAVCELVTSIGRAMGISEVSAGFLKRIYSLGGGHPWITRVIAGASYTHRAAHDRLTKADLDHGYAHLQDHYRIGSFVEKNFWELMTTEEKSVLASAAKRSRFLGSWGLSRLIKRRPLPEVQPEVLATLRAQGLLGTNGIPIGALQEWLLARTRT